MGTVYDVLAILVLVFELVLGFLDGFWVRFLRFFGLAVAVALSALYTGPLCKALLPVLEINSIKLGLLVWLLLFGVVALLAWLLVRWAEHTQDKKKGGGFLSVTSHLFGALFGVLHGVLLVLLVTWAYGMFRANFAPRAASFEDARLMPLVGRVNEAAAFAALNTLVKPEPLARRIAWQLGHPGRTMELWQDLLRLDSFNALLDSDSFWQSVLTGDEWGIQANESFQDLMHDKEAMRNLRILVLPVKDYEKVEARRVLAMDLASLGKAFVRIKDDEPAKALVDQMQQEQLFDKGRRAGLIKDMRFVRLVSNVMRAAAKAENE